MTDSESDWSDDEPQESPWINIDKTTPEPKPAAASTKKKAPEYSVKGNKDLDYVSQDEKLLIDSDREGDKKAKHHGEKKQNPTESHDKKSPTKEAHPQTKTTQKKKKTNALTDFQIKHMSDIDKLVNDFARAKLFPDTVARMKQMKAKNAHWKCLKQAMESNFAKLDNKEMDKVEKEIQKHIDTKKKAIIAAEIEEKKRAIGTGRKKEKRRRRKIEKRGRK